MAPISILHNARVFVTAGSKSPEHRFVDCLALDESSGLITHVGSLDDAAITDIKASATHHDMKGRLLIPGFIDGHMHLLVFAQSLKKAVLDHCKTADDVFNTIKAFAAEHPGYERILCKGWMPHMTGGKATAEMIDELDPRPIFIDSKDQHSTWCNTAALRELGVEYGVPDPPGGTIHRDENGKATGLLSEACSIFLVWPHIARVASMEQNMAAVKEAMSVYVSHGYTGLTEMAMEENTWNALLALREREGLPIPVAAYWLIRPGATEEETLGYLDKAIELYQKYNAETSPDLRIVGIKIICDGTVDACTAALTQPYANGITYDTLWPKEALEPVVAKAVAAGLQCALHAIGDAAVKNAIDVLAPHAGPNARHRIEHLELSSAEDARRLGEYGIIASVQPVHADPAILRQWPLLIGSHRCSRAFAYKDFADGGAVLAVGSDAPTANMHPLRNLYTATTRRSARDPALEERVNPHFALSMAASFAAATEGSAYGCFADKWTGRLEVGKMADLAVVDAEWDADTLLEAKVVQTWYRGKVIFDGE